MPGARAQVRLLVNGTQITVAIQVIPLPDHHGSSEAGSRARGFRQIRPPDLALRDLYHSLCSRIRRAAAVTNGSVGLFSWSMT